MTFMRTNFGFFIAFIVIGAILGHALGSLIVTVIPDAKIITANLTEAVSFDLHVIFLKVRLSISAIVGIIAGLLIFLKI